MKIEDKLIKKNILSWILYINSLSMIKYFKGLLKFYINSREVLIK